MYFWGNHSGNCVVKMPWGSKSLQDYYSSMVRDDSSLNTNGENGHTLENIFK